MNNREPLISVLVPVYNIEKYIGACIESIIKQTYKNLEIIVVDDGSTDRSAEICDLYATKDSRVKVIHKANGGLVSARKAGIEVSTGEYIGYVDGDDWIGPDFYESLCSDILENNSDVVVAGQSRDLFDKSEVFYNSLQTGLYCGERIEYLFSNLISNGNFYRPGIFTYLWNKLFKRSVIFDSQMNVDNGITIGEDAAVVYPALLNCRSVYVSENTSYHYRQREDSMLKKSKTFLEELDGLKLLYKSLSEFAKTTPSQYDIQRQVDEFVLSICIIRSGGIIPNERIDYSPYSSDFKNKRIVVFSAGTFGQQLINRFNEKQYCYVVGWIDDDYWEYRRCCLNVDSVESITEYDFDYVLIATVNSMVSTEIKSRLLNLGVKEDNILEVSCSNMIRNNLLSAYIE